ncbi:hypothetical protein BCR34DRAFT_59422 [Clohesyomyces aquaticus]|uniref:Uncharacterized protein n=1 Tax=Clohesyomyces aquaticus TaxID=1231657 RepID=A0A1Y1Z2P9_9PLEO|nr:hypothetical protein BCR34DRAFT_59422 [Clohesyomyces aquaticus]
MSWNTSKCQQLGLVDGLNTVDRPCTTASSGDLLHLHTLGPILVCSCLGIVSRLQSITSRLQGCSASTIPPNQVNNTIGLLGTPEIRLILLSRRHYLACMPWGSCNTLGRSLLANRSAGGSIGDERITVDFPRQVDRVNISCARTLPARDTHETPFPTIRTATFLHMLRYHLVPSSHAPRRAALHRV